MVNPILKREILAKIRSFKFTGMITGYGLVLAFFSIIFLRSITRGQDMIRLDSISALFVSLVFFIYFIICFVSPALTSSSINSEEKGRTLDLLICSPISAKKIVSGKIISSLISVIYLLIVTMPLFALLFMFGGLTLFDVVIYLGYFIITTLFYGSIGVFFSSRFNKISVSTVLSYVVIFFLNIATIIIGVAIPEIFDFSKSAGEIFSYILYFNPGYGLMRLVSITTNNADALINGITPRNEMIIVIFIEITLFILFSLLAAKKISPLKE